MSDSPSRPRPLPARHADQPRRSPARTAISWIAAAMGVVLVSSASLAAIAVTDISRQVTDNAVDLGEPGVEAEAGVAAATGGFNVLVVGTDNDAEQGDSFGVREQTLNDVNILLHVSEDQRSATVVSFPRDLIVDQPACTDDTTGVVSEAVTDASLNTAYARGGLRCVNDTIQQLTGLQVPYAGTVSFNGVIALSDAVGGVPVCLTGPIRDTDSGLDLPAGTSVVSGSTALAFLRTRHGVGDQSDLARISSQQQYLSSLMRQLKSADTLSNPITLYSLAQAAAQNMRLSTNLTSADTMVSLGLALKDIDLATMTFVQYPGTTEDPDFPNKVVPIQETADALFQRIMDDQPFTLAEEGTGIGETVDPTATAAPDPAQPTDEATTDPTTPATETPSTVIEGLTGQTADEETCAVPSD